MIDFDEYIRQGEPQKREKSYAWQTAIGLQAVDGLKPSDYLIETARNDIEGETTDKKLLPIESISYPRRFGNVRSRYRIDPHPPTSYRKNFRLYIGRTDIHSSPDL